ncbi:MAG: hypothetical protein NVSMB2_15960 [Chloroflexota bacterium]
MAGDLPSPATSLGVEVPQRDYFQAAMRGQRFVTGVTIPTSSPLPSIYHSVPIPGGRRPPGGCAHDPLDAGLGQRNCDREQARVLAGTANRLCQLVAPFRATVPADNVVVLRRAA